MKRLARFGIIAVFVFSTALLSACQASSFNEEEVQYTSLDVKVGFAFPKSGFSLLDESTVGRWVDVEKRLKEDLIKYGLSKENLISYNDNTVAKQVVSVDKLIQDEHVDVLIVVPLEKSISELKAESYAKGDLVDENGDGILTENEQKPPSQNDKDTEKNAKSKRTLAEAVNEAKDEHIFTIGWGSVMPSDFTFDFFAAMPSVEDIANVQAGYIENELGLTKVECVRIGFPEKDVPLPVDSSNNFQCIDSETSGKWTKPETPKTIEWIINDALRDTSKRYYTTLLSRLLQYYQSGQLVSLSSTVTAESTVEDFRKVAIAEDGDKAAGVMHNRLDKFYNTFFNNEARLSATVAQSDALSRGAVRACVEAGWNQGSEYWPLVTGFGAEKSSITDIVEQKQSMTISYDSIGIADAIARMIVGEFGGGVTTVDSALPQRYLRSQIDYDNIPEVIPGETPVVIDEKDENFVPFGLLDKENIQNLLTLGETDASENAIFPKYLLDQKDETRNVYPEMVDLKINKVLPPTILEDGQIDPNIKTEEITVPVPILVAKPITVTANNIVDTLVIPGYVSYAEAGL